MINQSYNPLGVRTLPPVVKNLLIINALFFLATLSFGKAWGIDLSDRLGMHFITAEKFRVWQFITYMFMHGGFTHLLFNMFALWMFGRVLENTWGSRRFLIYYFITGIGAGVVQQCVQYIELRPTLTLIDQFIESGSFEQLNAVIGSHKFYINEYSGEMWSLFNQFQGIHQKLLANPDNTLAMQQAINFMQEYREYYLNLSNVVGASGAVFGLLLAFGMMFPNSLIYLYFAIPIKAKYFVIIYGAFELYGGVTNSMSNVAHFAHLGGMLFGFALIKYWKSRQKNSY